MRRLGALSEEEVELLIERKILETLGDPDAGVELRPEFKEKLRERPTRQPPATRTSRSGLRGLWTRDSRLPTPDR